MCGRNVFLGDRHAFGLSLDLPRHCGDGIEGGVETRAGFRARLPSFTHCDTIMGFTPRELDRVGLILGALVDRVNNTAYPEKLGCLLNPLALS
ncbi:unnamed protein product [Ectocarpus sp. 12 AP-2014]